MGFSKNIRLIPIVSCGNEKGFSLIEILIASAIFMIGFTLLMFLLNNATTNFSYKEKSTALNLAREYMDAALLSNELESIDATVMVSNIKYRVIQDIDREDSLININIFIIRESTNRELITLYAEKTIR